MSDSGQGHGQGQGQGRAVNFATALAARAAGVTHTSFHGMIQDDATSTRGVTMAETQHRSRIGQGGRLVIPKRIREVLGLGIGTDVVLVAEEDGLRVLTREQAIERARARVRRVLPRDRSLSEELIAERRAEAGRE
ncbi:MAG: AbrB/MazE/SpoVT family DNA-binding domain-containing protein [Myxococcota bacterium]